jgi:Bacterial protein of unknown function (DUF922)
MRLLLLFTLTCLLPPTERFQIWTQDQPLRWEAFRGVPPANEVMSAQTQTKFSFSWSCDPEGRFEAKVKVFFDCEKSWVKGGQGSDALLAHEQLHFDIAELIARRLRQTLQALESPCALGDEGIKKIAQKSREVLSKFQDQYDNETIHGEDKVAQARWAGKVHQEMEDLADYVLQ